MQFLVHEIFEEIREPDHTLFKNICMLYEDEASINQHSLMNYAKFPVEYFDTAIYAKISWVPSLELYLRKSG